jgi:uncharacterized protein (TIGR02444 family)
MGVAPLREAALRLQDAHTLNANLALWCLWCAREGFELPDGEVSRLTAHVHDMDRYVTRRLREVRRFLSSPRPGFPPDGLQALRREIYEAELAGERLIQLRMERDTRATARAPSPPADEAAFEEAARRLFAFCRDDLETPVLLADDRGPFGPDALFGTMIEHAPRPAAAGVGSEARHE